MQRVEFEQLVARAFEEIPDKFKERLKNVTFVVESHHSKEDVEAQGLSERDELLGLYVGIPLSERGSEYGTGPTLPDVIHIYQKPHEEIGKGKPEKIARAVSETVWHEVAHYLGMDEEEVEAWEQKKWRKS